MPGGASEFLLPFTMHLWSLSKCYGNAGMQSGKPRTTFNKDFKMHLVTRIR